jgi:hypothetical protein
VILSFIVDAHDLRLAFFTLTTHNYQISNMKSTMNPVALTRLGFLWILAAQLDFGFFGPVVGVASAFQIILQPSVRHGSSSLAYNVGTVRRQRRAIDVGLQASGEEDDESNKEEPPMDSAELQRELNAMMAPVKASSTESWGGGANNDDDDDDDDETPSLYNAVPLYTGAVVTAATFALTGYLIYAGLTGDDPLAGHPLQS